MSEQTIRLNSGEWAFDEASPLGRSGGFGAVFNGRGPKGSVAVKRLHLSAADAAHRELSIAAELAGRPLAHVVPILDYGQDAVSDRYYIVMPLCEGSLQDHIHGGPLPFEEAKEVALQIIDGLKEVAGLVHRDLKPANILRHEGMWKIADFGIAKFVEDSTSLATLRDCLSPPFAAPEQWQGERPAPATDVYALGCILHALLNGVPPFPGDLDAVREGHLRRPPPRLQAPGAVSALVGHMLRKSPAGRPPLDRCRVVIASATEAMSSPAVAALSDAAARVAAERAATEAAETARRAREEQHAVLAREAVAELAEIRRRLFEEVSRHSIDAAVGEDTLLFGQARVTIKRSEIVRAHDGVTLAMSGWGVAAYSMVEVAPSVPSARGQPYAPSMTLLFADRKDGHGYRWYEVGFWSLGASALHREPCALPLGRDLDIALSKVMGIYQLAFGPAPIDGEDEEDFRSRWLGLISRAATGDLQHPGRMPVPPSFWGR